MSSITAMPPLSPSGLSPAEAVFARLDAQLLGGPVLAADRAGDYDTDPPAEPAAAPCGAGWADPAAAYPVLAEVPELGAVLDTLREVDRLIASAIDGIIRLQDHDVAETVTGVPLEQWLLIVARRTGTDRRMLLATAEVCRRIPALREAFGQGQISWGQVRTLVLQILKLPRVSDDALDDAVAELVARARGLEPDALGQLAGWLTDQFTDHDEPGDPDDGEVVEFLALQPRLDGTGGRFFGQAGPTNFAILEARTQPGPPTGTARDGFGTSPDPGRARRLIRDAGRDRLERLIDLIDTDHTGDGGRVVPTLLVRAELDTLLDRDRTPAQLLTHLAGGRMILTSTAARRLIDQRGADLRSVILDDTGAVVGVGRKTRVPPGWLAHAILAVHDTCTEPGCNVAARGCDLDHAQPWHPARPDHVPGPTDVDNLAPLCRPANRTKETDGWTCTQTGDGTRRWHHTRTGLTVGTIPATVRPPLPRASLDPSDHPPGDPPGDPPAASATTDPPGDPPDAPPGDPPDTAPPGAPPPTGDGTDLDDPPF